MAFLNEFMILHALNEMKNGKNKVFYTTPTKAYNIFSCETHVSNRKKWQKINKILQKANEGEKIY